MNTIIEDNVLPDAPPCLPLPPTISEGLQDTQNNEVEFNFIDVLLQTSLMDPESHQQQDLFSEIEDLVEASKELSNFKSEPWCFWTRNR